MENLRGIHSLLFSKGPAERSETWGQILFKTFAVDCLEQTGHETIDRVLESGSMLFNVHKVSGDSKNILEMGCIKLYE